MNERKKNKLKKEKKKNQTKKKLGVKKYEWIMNELRNGEVENYYDKGVWRRERKVGLKYERKNPLYLTEISHFYLVLEIGVLAKVKG